MKKDWQSEREVRRRPPLALYHPPHQRVNDGTLDCSPPHKNGDDGTFDNSTLDCPPHTHQRLYCPPHQRKVPVDRSSPQQSKVGSSSPPQQRKVQVDCSSSTLPHKGNMKPFHLEVEVQPNQWWHGVIQVKYIPTGYGTGTQGI